MNSADYRAIGEELWRGCWKDAEGEKEAWAECQDFVRKGKARDATHRLILGAMLADPILRLLAVWCANWCGLGFPQVVVPDRLAASLMSTSVRGAAASLVRLPWPYFAIQIPDGLVSFEAQGRTISANRLHVSNADGKAVLHLTSGSAPLVALYVGFDSERDLFDADAILPIEESARGAGHDWLDVSVLVPIDKRALTVARRLLTGVCIEMSAPDYEREVASRPPTPSGKVRRKGKAPVSWTFTLRRDVRVDCRPAVRSYMSGAGKAPSVQRLHRGHWQEQVHGPNNSLRKWKWHEPYWQGSEDAPIAVRAHALPEKDVEFNLADGKPAIADEPGSS